MAHGETLTLDADRTLHLVYATDALTGVKADGEVVTKLEAGKSYLFYDATTAPGRAGYRAILSGNAINRYTAAEGMPPTAIWTLEGSGSRFKVKNEHTALYVPQLVSSTPTTASKTGGLFTFALNGDGTTWNIKGANGSTVLYLSTFVPFLVAILCIVLIVLLVNSTYGRAFKAIRDDEVAAEAMGINLAKHKMLSFVVSSFFAGVGGALFAMYVANAQAKVYTTTMTYEILLIVVIGGIGSISGSCIATFLYVACSEWWLRFLDKETVLDGGFQVPLLRNGFRMVVFSVIIMIVVLFFRKGILGDRELPEVIAGWKRKRAKRKEAAQ